MHKFSAKNLCRSVGCGKLLVTAGHEQPKKEGFRPLVLSFLVEKPVRFTALRAVANQGSLGDSTVSISCDHLSFNHIIMLTKHSVQNTLQHFHFFFPLSFDKSIIPQGLNLVNPCDC